ncbi:MAG TPA: lysophospholipid acyltransferase family protein [Bacteroidales bacterium]|nr:lysophospholipid acyltransferase family protein [Bacteroidales bacterium]
MKRILFYIFYAFIYIITLLPLRILYIFSDLMFVLLYYFPSYRRKIVADNLKNSFPEKSEKERKIIARRYYRHMADIIIETIKEMHLSKRQVQKRFRIQNPELYEKYYAQGRDVLAVCSHYNNWEWLSSFVLSSKLKCITAYKPLSNKFFDRMMLDIRSKYGTETAPTSAVLKRIVKYRMQKMPTISAFIADQTPPKGEHVHWTTFLNQDTSFYIGTEKVAVMLDMVVVFIHIKKIKRGFYEAESIVITEHPKDEPPGAITEMHVRMLEKVIREEPEYWLWSHRRWKHKRPVND